MLAGALTPDEEEERRRQALGLPGGYQPMANPQMQQTPAVPFQRPPATRLELFPEDVPPEFPARGTDMGDFRGMRESYLDRMGYSPMRGAIPGTVQAMQRQGASGGLATPDMQPFDATVSLPDELMPNTLSERNYDYKTSQKYNDIAQSQTGAMTNAAKASAMSGEPYSPEQVQDAMQIGEQPPWYARALAPVLTALNYPLSLVQENLTRPVAFANRKAQEGEIAEGTSVEDYLLKQGNILNPELLFGKFGDIESFLGESMLGGQIGTTVGAGLNMLPLVSGKGQQAYTFGDEGQPINDWQEAWNQMVRGSGAGAQFYTTAEEKKDLLREYNEAVGREEDDNWYLKLFGNDTPFASKKDVNDVSRQDAEAMWGGDTTPLGLFDKPFRGIEHLMTEEEMAVYGDDYDAWWNDMKSEYATYQDMGNELIRRRNYSEHDGFLDKVVKTMDWVPRVIDGVMANASWSDVATFGEEIITDPVNWFTGGGKAIFGKTALSGTAKELTESAATRLVTEGAEAATWNTMKETALGEFTQEMAEKQAAAIAADMAVDAQGAVRATLHTEDDVARIANQLGTDKVPIKFDRGINENLYLKFADEAEAAGDLELATLMRQEVADLGDDALVDPMFKHLDGGGRLVNTRTSQKVAYHVSDRIYNKVQGLAIKSAAEMGDPSGVVLHLPGRRKTMTNAAGEVVTKLDGTPRKQWGTKIGMTEPWQVRMVEGKFDYPVTLAFRTTRDGRKVWSPASKGEALMRMKRMPPFRQISKMDVAGSLWSGNPLAKIQARAVGRESREGVAEIQSQMFEDVQRLLKDAEDRGIHLTDEDLKIIQYTEDMPVSFEKTGWGSKQVDMTDKKGTPGRNQDFATRQRSQAIHIRNKLKEQAARYRRNAPMDSPYKADQAKRELLLQLADDVDQGIVAPMDVSREYVRRLEELRPTAPDMVEGASSPITTRYEPTLENQPPWMREHTKRTSTKNVIYNQEDAIRAEFKDKRQAIQDEIDRGYREVGVMNPRKRRYSKASIAKMEQQITDLKFEEIERLGEMKVRVRDEAKQIEDLYNPPEDMDWVPLDDPRHPAYLDRLEKQGQAQLDYAAKNPGDDFAEATRKAGQEKLDEVAKARGTYVEPVQYGDEFGVRSGRNPFREDERMYQQLVKTHGVEEAERITQAWDVIDQDVAARGGIEPDYSSQGQGTLFEPKAGIDSATARAVQDALDAGVPVQELLRGLPRDEAQRMLRQFEKLGINVPIQTWRGKYVPFSKTKTVLTFDVSPVRNYKAVREGLVERMREAGYGEKMSEDALQQRADSLLEVWKAIEKRMDEQLELERNAGLQVNSVSGAPGQQVEVKYGKGEAWGEPVELGTGSRAYHHHMLKKGWWNPLHTLSWLDDITNGRVLEKMPPFIRDRMGTADVDWATKKAASGFAGSTERRAVGEASGAGAHAAQKHRAYDSMEQFAGQVRQGGFEPEENALIAASARVEMGSRAISTKQYIDNMLDEFGVRVDTNQAGIKPPPNHSVVHLNPETGQMTKGAPRGLEETKNIGNMWVIRDDLADHIIDATNSLTSTVDTAWLARSGGYMTNLFKMWAAPLNPRFAIVNTVGNMWNVYLKGGTEALSAPRFDTVLEIMSGAHWTPQAIDRVDRVLLDDFDGTPEAFRNSLNDFVDTVGEERARDIASKAWADETVAALPGQPRRALTLDDMRSPTMESQAYAAGDQTALLTRLRTEWLEEDGARLLYVNRVDPLTGTWETGTVTYHQLYNAMRRHRAIGGGFFQNDVAAHMEDMVRAKVTGLDSGWREVYGAIRSGQMDDVTRAMGEGMRSGRYNPASMNFAPYNVIRDKQGFVEDVGRALMYLDTYYKTGDSVASALAVRDILFDYGEVTPQMARFGKMAVPFWTWTRNNVPLQFRMLFDQPRRMMPFARFENFMANVTENMVGDVYGQQGSVPDWMTMNLALQTPVQDEHGNALFTDIRLPLADLEFLTANPRESATQVLTPYATLPTEWVTGRSTYTGKEIENFPLWAFTRTLPGAGSIYRAAAPGAYEAMGGASERNAPYSTQAWLMGITGRPVDPAWQRSYYLREQADEVERYYQNVLREQGYDPYTENPINPRWRDEDGW